MTNALKWMREEVQVPRWWYYVLVFLVVSRGILLWLEWLL